MRDAVSTEAVLTVTQMVTGILSKSDKILSD